MPHHSSPRGRGSGEDIRYTSFEIEKYARK